MTVRKSTKPNPKKVTPKVKAELPAAKLMEGMIEVAQGQKEAIERLIALVGSAMRFQAELNQSGSVGQTGGPPQRAVNECAVAAPKSIGNVQLNANVLMSETNLLDERLEVLTKLLDPIMRGNESTEASMTASSSPPINCRMSDELANVHQRIRRFRATVDMLIEHIEL